MYKNLVGTLPRYLHNIIINLKKGNISNSILIVFSGLLGDGVLALNMIQSLTKYYIIKRKIVYIVARSNVIELFKIGGIDNRVKLVDVDLKKYCIDGRYYCEINRSILSEYFDTVIFPQQSITSIFVALNVKARETIAVLDRTQVRNKTIKNILDKMGYTKRLYVENFCNILIRFQRLSNYICNVDEIAKTPRLHIEECNENEIGKKSHYVVLTPYASDGFREWDIIKYKQLTDWILKLGYKVVFSVMEAKGDLTEIVKKYPRDKVSISQHTSLVEMLLLIKNATLLIGADSAPIHLASSLGTQAVCIQTGRDGEQLYPYRAIRSDGTKYPICVQTKAKACFGCHIRFGIEGFGNSDCMRQKKLGKKSLCVEEITVGQVYDRVKEILTDESIIK